MKITKIVRPLLTLLGASRFTQYNNMLRSSSISFNSGNGLSTLPTSLALRSSTALVPTGPVVSASGAVGIPKNSPYADIIRQHRAKNINSVEPNDSVSNYKKIIEEITGIKKRSKQVLGVKPSKIKSPYEQAVEQATGVDPLVEVCVGKSDKFSSALRAISVDPKKPLSPSEKQKRVENGGFAYIDENADTDGLGVNSHAPMESFPVEIPASTPVMISKAAPIVPYDNKGIVAGGGDIQLIVPNGTMQCTGKGGPFLFKPTSHEELASEARRNKIAVYLAAKELKDEGRPEYKPIDPEGPAKFDLHLMSIGDATELPNLSQISEGQLPLLVQKGTAIYIYGAKTLGRGGPVALDYTKLDETVFSSNPIGFPPVGAGELGVTKDKMPEAIYQEIASKEGHLVSSKLPNRFTVVDVDRLSTDSHRAAPEDSVVIDDESTPRL